MIPTFIAKQQELKPEMAHIQNVGKELKQLQEEFGVVIKQVPPMATTSFMSRRGSQAKQYDIITNQIRNNRISKFTYRQQSQASIRAQSRQA